MTRTRHRPNYPAGAARAYIDASVLEAHFRAQGREYPDLENIHLEDIDGLFALPAGMSLYRLAPYDRWVGPTLGLVIISDVPGQLPAVKPAEELPLMQLGIERTTEEPPFSYRVVAGEVWEPGRPADTKLMLPEDQAAKQVVIEFNQSGRITRLTNVPPVAIREDATTITYTITVPDAPQVEE